MPRYFWLLAIFLVAGAYFAGTMNLLPSIPVLTSTTLFSPSTTAPPQSLTPKSNSELSPSLSSPSSSATPLDPQVVQIQQQESAPDNGNNISTTKGRPQSSASEISLPEIFKNTENSVVQITSTRPGSNEVVILNGREIPQNNVALGSGFVYDHDGRIITNHHVVSEVQEVDVTFVDGDTYTAKVVGKDPYSDIGMLQITDPEFFKKGVEPLRIANSSEIQVGEQIIAIGNPFGLSGTLTTGVISQIGRLLPNVVTGYSIANTIQTDAAINPGNSGGPLLNMNGEVVGMNTAIFSNTGVYSGVGFAIPSNMLLKEIPVLIQKGSYVHPWLGFTAKDLSPDIAESMGLARNYKGAAIVSVVDNSPADKAGVRGEIIKESFGGGAEVVRSGDIVTKIDSQPVKSMDDVISHLDENKKVGDKVVLTVNREGKVTDVTVTLEERPSGSPQLIATSSSQQEEKQDQQPDQTDPNPPPPLFQFPKIPGFPELPKIFP
jgi:S1-C subfamily serine protease